jgi:threonine dehydratase
VLRARRRIAPYVRRTPLVRSPGCPTCPAASLAEARVAAGSQLVQVARRVQRGHRAPRAAGRRRRARHGLGRQSRPRARGGRRTFSCRWSCSRRRCAATKLDAIRAHGADAARRRPRLRRGGADGEGVRRDTGAEFISPYNDADVIAGAATVALEMFEDAAIDTLVVPIGGGG